MSSTETVNWYETNKRCLMSALAIVRELLESRTTSPQDNPEQDKYVQNKDAEKTLQEAVSAMPAPPALDTLCTIFCLSPFERNVLLLCAGVELDSTFGSLCAAAQGDPRRNYPTFSLALAALPDAHWSALTPSSPLRRWHLIEIGNGDTLTQSSLRIDERVLHYLTGVQYLDERLAGIIEPLHVSVNLLPSYRAQAERLARVWSQAASNSALPIVQLCGDDVTGKHAIAAAACSALGLNLSMVSASSLPVTSGEVDAFIRLWEREAALGSNALLLDCDEIDPTDTAREKIINRLIERIRSALVVTSKERRVVFQRVVITFDIPRLTAEEQRTIWNIALGTATSGMNGQVVSLVSQFNLNTQAIHNACAEALGNFTENNNTRANPEELDTILWDACLKQSRPRLDNLAQRIEPVATWDDIVLPEPQTRTLHEIVMHVKQRFKVYDEWGFASRGSRGLGISALFTGDSGTGKTMAAEVIANELRLDLYKIDLSQVVSKYIGETEKNLRRIFDAAEEGGAILLFDEADALFGKRGEVKDSHDRYANIEVSYLLQRMEAYRGLAILTTNMKNSLDPAFLRRIRFIVQFPFPDAVQRAQIWQRIFPSSTPTRRLDVKKLARLNVAGGNIRNIALNAAFMAADEGEAVGMKHLLYAARSECAKLEKSLSEAEIGGWI
jgi:ATP-dependent 26S proteasome regulatory subunit